MINLSSQINPKPDLNHTAFSSQHLQEYVGLRDGVGMGMFEIGIIIPKTLATFGC